MAGSSRAEAPDGPGVVLAEVGDAVVQAAGTALPEFNGDGGEAEAAPEVGEGDFAAFGPAMEEFGLALGEGLAVGDGGALEFGDPGTDLGAMGAAAEVGFGFLAVGAGDRAADEDLAFEFLPEKDEGGVGIFGEVDGFAGAVVGEEAEAMVVEALEEDGAAGGMAQGVGGGEGHGVRFDHATAEGLIEPEAELRDGIGMDLRFVEAGLGVVLAEVGEDEVGIAHGGRRAVLVGSMRESN